MYLQMLQKRLLLSNMTLHLEMTKPIKQYPYQENPIKLQSLKKAFIIGQSKSKWNSS